MKSLLTYATILWVWISVVPLNGAGSAKVYAQLKAASVEILVNGRLAGAGSVVDAQGHVLIANHMAPGEGARLEAQSKTLGVHALKVVARDKAHDLMLLQLPARKEAYPNLTLARNQPKAGQPVFLFGAPVFRHEVMISGMMARDQATYEFYDGAFREIYHISAIAPIGTSGGPWVNVKGELIGVQSAAMTINGAHQGIAYSSPLYSLRELLDKKKPIQSATMQTGVEELWGQEPGFINKLPKDFRGLVVRQLQGNGVAAKAGLKEWDIIVAIDEQPVKRTDDLMRLIRSREPGQTVRLKATDREGKNARDLTIKLVAIN
ncbi:MAG: S1C family serine protease [Verrucomicrobiota bacterium]|nr:S1C family serine protease [Verrucomicrobiota bacterium]